METTAPTATENPPETTPAAESVAELTLGSGAPAAEADKPHAAPTIRGRIDKFGVAMGTGRRKTAVARVRIRRGSGKLTINNRPLADYFHVERNRALIQRPLEATEMAGRVDIWVRAQGGGTTGQVGAIVLGIARALQALEPTLHARLSEGGYLTRDGRMVERKKYGFKKARRSFQFSKR
jgi:small subunit ribosomal protein S9